MPVFLLPIITAAGTLLRFPAIAAFIAGLAAEFVSFFFRFFSLKTAIQLAVIATVVTLSLAAFTAIKSLMLALTFVAPPFFIQAMSLIVPDNFAICATTIASAHVVRWVWEWKIYFIMRYAETSRN